MQHAKRLMLMLAMLAITAVPALAKDYDLHQAVLDNDIGLVDKLIRKGLFIDEIGSRKYGYGSALHLAVREGRLEIAKLLLERGAQVDVLDPDDLTPLHNAAWNGNLEMAQLLLDAGADIEASTYDGDTPLSLAQKNDQPRVAEFIQAKLQPSATSGTKVELTPASDSGIIDISGTYVADITGPISKMIKNRSATNQIVKIERSGDIFIGSFDDGRGELYVEIEGEEFKFDWRGFSAAGKGTWTLKPGSKDLVGTWYKTGGTVGHTGNWNLTRIDAEPPQMVDISGTYAIAELTYPSDVNKGYYHWYFGKGKDLKMTIEQDGEVVSGVLSGEATGEFKGAVKGNEITFDYDVVSTAGASRWGSGVLMVSEDSTELVGTFFMKNTSSGSFTGQWKFRKAKSERSTSLTGTYTSKLTYPATLRRNDYRWFLGESGLEVSIEQKGNAISGIFTQGGQGKFRGKGIFKGKIEGNEVSVELDVKPDNAGQKYGTATWIIGADGNSLTGEWQLDGSTGVIRGLWDLAKIGSDAASIVDVSGTYSVEIDMETGQTKPRRKVTQVTIVQSGNQISGNWENSEGKSQGKVYGDIEGSTIAYEWNGIIDGSGKGEWTIRPGGNELTGSFYATSSNTGGVSGKLNLTKIQ